MSEANFFYVTIKVNPNKSGYGDFCCQTESVTSALKKYVHSNSNTVGVLVQSVHSEEEGRLLTLSFATRFGAPRNRIRLRQYLRDEMALALSKNRPDSLRATGT